MTEGKIIAEARDVTKRFPGVVALDKVCLRIVAGKVNALVGENGAGKSTLMNILSGVYTDYDGAILVNGETRHFRDVNDARRSGIAIIHQELNSIPNMNIAENLFLGREPMTRLGFIDHKRMHQEARKWIDRLHLLADTHTLIADLRVGQRQLVEIAKALMQDANVLIMDEPTSSLSESETEILFSIIRELTERGVGIVYISHKMDEIWQLADFVTILRDGKLIAELDMKETHQDEVIRMMVGRERKEFFVKEEHETGAPVLEVEHLSLFSQQHTDKKTLDDISFSVRKGEVLGFYGLMGAGRPELFEALFGMHPDTTEGIVKIEGKEVRITHPEEAVASGMAFCPEDRKRDGLVLQMPIGQNITLASLKDCLSAVSTLDRQKEQSIATKLREQLAIKSSSLTQPAVQLSGGNQQKIVLAKWLLTAPKILFLDEPTRGIDIHSKNEIYQLIDEMARQGKAVVIASSELPEIIAIADCIITLRQGKTSKTFLRSEFSEESILKASLPE